MNEPYHNEDNVRILFVEDDKWLSEMYVSALRRITGIEVFVADSADSALSRLDETSVDLIVLDMYLGEHNGVEFLHEILSYDDTNKVPVMILSAVHENDFAMQKDRWRHYNVVEYLYKPNTKPDQLVAAVKKQLLGAVEN